MWNSCGGYFKFEHIFVGDIRLGTSSRVTEKDNSARDQTATCHTKNEDCRIKIQREAHQKKSTLRTTVQRAPSVR